MEQSFSAVASGQKKEFIESTSEFPLLKTRQEILLSNLLVLKTINDKFNLMGLVDIIQMKNEDQSVLALGCDLSSLNLNLNSNDAIYSTFMTPFDDVPTQDCYILAQPLRPALTKLSSFSDETLFYIFYSLVRDVLQEAAAQELYKRQWRFHKEFKLWLTKDKSPSNVYIFFDPSSWSCIKKEWTVHYHQLEERVQQENSLRGTLQSE